MCGISGQFNFSGSPISPSTIERMADSIVHRGPDDAGVSCDGPIGLGHRRLSIIDLSPSGRQPMWSNDETCCVVYNGEVYNHLEIRQDLLAKGYHFSSTTDTEVVVNAIHCWGIERALEKFIGMFAFALWDKRNQTLSLCRDRAGVKPLYYYVTDEMLLFGSEMRALMAHPRFIKELNPVALGQYFVNGYFLDNRTVFKNTFKLTPGHYLIIDRKGALKLHKYWGLDSLSRDSFQGSFEDAARQLEHLLESAFSYRLVSDVPVGLFLSGGIDSSLVSAILKKKAHADILNITIGFKEKAFDETLKAKSVSEQLGIRHVVHYVDTKQAQETLLKFCDVYDEPFADTSGIPTYILSKLAREHVKVALSADGGDEQFCGYENYSSYARNYQALKKIPWVMRVLISRLLEFLPYKSLLSLGQKWIGSDYHPQSIARYEKLLRLLKVGNDGDLISLMNEKGWSKTDVSEFVPTHGADVFRNTALSLDWMHGQSKEIIDTMMRTDYMSFLRDDILVKVDRASMAVSLECRDPFLDHRITEFAYRLPLNFLLGHGKHKRILKEILQQWVSPSIISSPKRGFSIPLYHWLRGIWKPIVLEYLSKARVKSVGVLDEKKVEKEVADFYKYRGCRAEKIWMMLNFQMWAEKWYLI